MNVDRELDVRGLNCPMPILKTKKLLGELSSGQTLRVVATDPGSSSASGSTPRARRAAFAISTAWKARARASTPPNDCAPAKARSALASAFHAAPMACAFWSMSAMRAVPSPPATTRSAG